MCAGNRVHTGLDFSSDLGSEPCAHSHLALECEAFGWVDTVGLFARLFQIFLSRFQRREQFAVIEMLDEQSWDDVLVEIHTAKQTFQRRFE